MVYSRGGPGITLGLFYGIYLYFLAKSLVCIYVYTYICAIIIKQSTMTTETIYKSEKIEVKGITWEVLKASGKYNYVTVRKVSNNPYGAIGKEFATEDLAIANYKSPAMKAALVQIFKELSK